MKPILLAFVLLFSLTGQVFAGDPPILFAEDDPALASAIKEARASLPEFLNFIATGKITAAPLAKQKYGLKVAFQGDRYVEHIWVGEFSRLDQTRFTGRLANEPEQLGTMKRGDKVTFFQSQISDWNLLRNGKGYGFYTVRIMRDYLSPEQAARLSAFLAPNPVPENW